MKTKLIVLFVLAIGMTTFIACTEETKDVIQNTLIGTMSASIGGVTWEANAPLGQIVGNQMTINGIGNKKNITLTMDGTSNAVYNVSVLNQNAAVLINNTDSASSSNYVAYTGTMSITSKTEENKRVSGTFDFVAINATSGDTLSVNGGQFNNIRYN